MIRSKTAKARVFLLAGKQRVTIESELTKTYSTGAAVMLAQMGRSYGRNLAREQKKVDANPRKVMEVMRVLAGVSGWGAATVKGDLETGRDFEITIDDCIFCADAEERDSSSCHFLVGVVQGIADEAYGGSHVARETACTRAGAVSCVVVLKA